MHTSNDWFYEYFINELKGVCRSRSSSVSKMVTITLLSDNWVGEGSLYTQTVDISSATSNSLIELRPSQEQLQELLTSGVSLMTANDSGTVTVFSIGGVPDSNYFIQAIVSEVNVI